MSVGEVSGIVELGQWSLLPDNTEVFLESTNKSPRRFRLTKRPREKRVSKVRHRRLGESLTDSPKCDTD